MDLLKKINKLKSLLKRYSYFYYTLGDPLISDSEYDYLLFLLKQFKKKNNNINNKYSFLDNSLISLSSEMFKVKHLAPMLSLSNIFSIKKYKTFHKKIFFKLNSKNIKFSCELKFDGIAVSLLYKNGKLIHAATRGNGFIGEDITENIFIIKYIPIYLSNFNNCSILEIRGEVLILHSDFLKLNKQLLKKNKKIFTNSRNAVFGILRKKNIENIYLEKLTFFCHSYGCIKGNIKINSHFDFMQKCKKWGFFVHESIRVFSSFNSIINFYLFFQKNKQKFNFSFDGIVIKVDCIKYHNILGFTTISPKWAVALKFKSKKKETKILDVIFKVGKTGIITPIAIMNPVKISGVVIKKASLHNELNIKKLGLFIGDTVVLIRSGEVIPKIVSVIKFLRDKNCFPILFPKKCPSCNSLIYKSKNSLFYCSGGMNCKQQLESFLSHFSSSEAFNIIGLSNGLIRKIIKYKFIKCASDLFFLTVKNLLSIPGIGKKKSINIINSLRKSKIINLSNFIYSLCIKNIGISKSKKLAFFFGNIQSFLLFKDIKYSFIGKSDVKNIILYLENYKNKILIKRLLKIVQVLPFNN